MPGRTVKKALAQLVALLFFMVGFGTTIWFQSWLFSMVFVVPVADLVLYGAILYKVHSQLKRSGKNSDGLTLRELFLAKSMALTGLVSVISTSPCIYAFAMFYFPPFYQWRLAKTQSCYRFPLLRLQVHLEEKFIATRQTIHFIWSSPRYIIHKQMFSTNHFRGTPNNRTGLIEARYRPDRTLSSTISDDTVFRIDQ